MAFDPQPCCGVSPTGPTDVNVVNTVAIAEPVDVNVLGTVPVSGSVGITGQPISVTGSTVAISGTVPVSGSVGITGQPVGVTGTVGISGTVPVSGTVGISGTVPVSGTVAISGTVPVSITGQPISVTGNTTVTGSTTASTTLTAASAIGNGATVDFGNAKSDVSLFILVNGTVTGGGVDLQASQDGTNWVRIAFSSGLATGTNQYLGMTGGAFRWFRGVITEAVTGGGSVTATLMFA